MGPLVHIDGQATDVGVHQAPRQTDLCNKRVTVLTDFESNQ